jgi:hypothetical protein
VAAIAYPDLSNLQVGSGYLVLAVPFLLKEVASGALKEAGKDLWVWAREKGSLRERQCRRR